MAKITYPDKSTGDPFYATEADEIRISVNAIYDGRDFTRVVLVEGDNTITFSTPLANGTNYEVLGNCFDSDGLVAYKIKTKNVNEFVVFASAASTFLYKLVIY